MFWAFIITTGSNTTKTATSDFIQGFFIQFHVLKLLKVGLCLFYCQFKAIFFSQLNEFFRCLALGGKCYLLFSQRVKVNGLL